MGSTSTLCALEITEITIQPVSRGESRNDRIVAFADLVLNNALAIHHMRIYNGPRGLAVAFPSERKLDRCTVCKGVNRLDARYCNQCGKPLPEGRLTRNENGRIRLYFDIVHPINEIYRSLFEQVILEEYGRVVARQESPDHEEREIRRAPLARRVAA